MTQLALDLSEKPTGPVPRPCPFGDHVHAAPLRPPCPVCGHTHASDDARAVGRFRPEGVEGYRARSGGPLRATRAEAVADECAGRVAA